jgi:hypothetical protein
MGVSADSAVLPQRKGFLRLTKAADAGDAGEDYETYE